jgi:gas vesicle protein GvpL/GvpF
VSDALVYLYAITGLDGARVATSDTVEGDPLRTIEEGALVALVADVPAVAYEQAALDENVRDAAWLTPRAAAHQSVNATAHVTTGASLPVPFGTIFRSDDRVREMLRTRAVELAARLEAVRGRAEWVVGLHRDARRAAEHLSRARAAAGERESVAASAGRRYLEQRKREGEVREDLRRLDREATGAADAALRPSSDRAFEEPVVEDAGDLIARTTYLVRRSADEDLRRSVDAFNETWQARGYELRATGPWPAYRSSGVTA